MANADLSAILDALRAIRNNQTILQDGLAGVIRRLNRVETAEEQKYVAAPIWRTSAVNAAGLSFDSSPTMTRKYSFRMPQFRDFSIPDLGNSFAASTSLANPQESRPYMRQHNYSQSTLGDTTGFVNEDISLLLPSPEKAPVDDVQLNGGFTAWSQVFVSFLLVFNGFGYFSSFGLFQSHWIELLHASPSDIAWVGSMMLFLLFFLGILSGPLMDRGHFRSILFIGCTFQVLGAFSTSGVTQYWQLILAQGVVQGIGNGMLFTPCVALVSIYFTKNRAFALSLAACGAPIGGIVFPLISRQLSGRIGYPWTIRIMGFIMLFNTVLILTLGRPRKFKKDKRSLLDPSAFKEPVYLFYAIGIFFTLWGLYIAYFYVSAL